MVNFSGSLKILFQISTGKNGNSWWNPYQICEESGTEISKIFPRESFEISA
jgi:hypothetical protein